ncbi:MAG TPA: RusA family crossover junction endodeoxyribonuclease [Thermoanaerobaculia bacterium]|nr:RusA family crossover junction endodeoxyribonuclease [Thermoanaerobaculia bacterium]
MARLEFIVFGTPVTSQGAARRFWQERVRQAGEEAAHGLPPSALDTFVLRVAYFHVSGAAGDLDNIVKPIQDALKGIAYADDSQVVDLVASMRRKGSTDLGPLTLTALLASGFSGGSDFVHVVVDHSSRIEVFQ